MYVKPLSLLKIPSWDWLSGPWAGKKKYTYYYNYYFFHFLCKFAAKDIQRRRQVWLGLEEGQMRGRKSKQNISLQCDRKGAVVIPISQLLTETNK